MGKRDKKAKKGQGAAKTSLKTNRKLEAKQKKLLQKLGERDIVEVVAQLEAEERRLTAISETVCLQPPSPRANFSLVAHPADKDELFLFGGEFYNGSIVKLYNDLFVYAIGKNEWRQIRSPGGPAPRSAHQMVATAANGGELWLFGGEHPSASQTQFFHYRDLWVFRLADRRWERMGTTGGPSARSGHRMVAHKKRLYVFGGFYDSGAAFTYHNDVWCFSLETYTWTELRCEGAVKPAPRSAGSLAVTPDGRLLVWGGYSRTTVKKDVDRGCTHTDMFVLVQDLKKDPAGFTWKWSSVKPGGVKPTPRSGVALTVNQQTGLGYTFGGVLDVDEDEENVQGNFSSEMFTVDVGKQVWRTFELKTGKAAKAGGEGDAGQSTEAAAKKVSDDGVFTMSVGGATTGVFGAPARSDRQRAKDSVELNGPSPRMKAGLVVCRKQLFVYGGIVEDGDKQTTLADFYALDLAKADKWRTIVGNEANEHEWMDDSDDDSDDEDDDDSDDSDDEDSDEESDDMDTD